MILYRNLTADFMNFHKLFIALILMASGFTGCLGDSPADDIAGDAYNGTPLAGGTATDFTIVDQNGDNFTLSTLEGDVVVVSFIFTRCPDVCPLTTLKMREVANWLEGAMDDEVSFISISMDPEHDDVEEMATYAQMHGAQWPHLTGDRETLENIWGDFGILVDRAYIESHASMEMESHEGSEMSHISVLYPDNSSELHGTMTNMLPENASGWNLTTMSFNSSNISLNYTEHEQWGHGVTGINGTDSPSDQSWWWSLYVWNSSNSSWEESMVGIDEIELNQTSYLAWAASSANLSLLPVMNEETVVHSSYTIILDDDLDLRLALGSEWTASELEEDVNTLLDERGDNYDTPAAGVVLSVIAVLGAAVVLFIRKKQRV